RIQFFAADIIEKEQRFGANHCDVVHAMIYQIGADGVVLVQCERDLEFRPDAIGARDENWIVHSGKIRAKQTAKAADFSENLRAVRLADERLDSPFQLVAKIDIDPGARVSLFHLWRDARRRVLIISSPRTKSDAVPDPRGLGRGLRVFP